jgi:hypothetical protein
VVSFKISHCRPGKLQIPLSYSDEEVIRTVRHHLISSETNEFDLLKKGLDTGTDVILTKQKRNSTILELTCYLAGG